MTASIDDDLFNVAVLGVDTVPFIYFVEKHPDYLQTMRTIFQRVTLGQIQIVSSTLTLTEVLTRPIETGHLIYQQEYRQMLLQTAFIESMPVVPRIAERAAQLRASYRLGTPDAIHIATALETQCQAFLTNDVKLRRVSEIKILILNDYIHKK